MKDTMTTTHKEALTEALFLSLTASTEDKSRIALRIAVELSSSMTDAEVAECKQAALERVTPEDLPTSGPIH